MLDGTQTADDFDRPKAVEGGGKPHWKLYILRLLFAQSSLESAEINKKSRTCALSLHPLKIGQLRTSAQERGLADSRATDN